MTSTTRFPAGSTGAVGSTTEEVDIDALLLDADSEVPPQLSVVMPTLNEEAGIRTCIERIKSVVEELQLPTEIIVSDSSTDRTPEIAAALGAIVIEPDEPGYGYAYRYALDQARGDVIAIGDADTTYDFGELPKLFEELERADADVVVGSRLEGEIKPGAMPALHRYVGNPLLTRFLNTFYGTDISDAHSGFRVFTQEALARMDLKTDGMEFASEMVMEASAVGLDVSEVPITYHEREGEETLDSFRDGWRHVRFMLTNAPTYLFSLPGIGAGILGLLVTLLAVSGVPVFGQTLGVNSLIAGSVFLLVSAHIIGLSVFSSVAGRTVDQPTDRLTMWIVKHVTLERGLAVGLSLLGAGVGYALYLVWAWVSSGFVAVPVTEYSLLACTAIVLGTQIVFSSFFLSVLE